MDRFELAKLNQGGIDELIELVSKHIKTGGFEKHLPRYAPLANVIHHISSLKPFTVIIQKDVQDPDFISEHQAFYSKWSYKVPRYCTRLHFFNKSSDCEDPLDVIDDMSRHRDCYLGFITFRPIRISPVGATIIRPPLNKNECFILSKDKFVVNLAGQTFVFEGTPFMQQDNAVGACAQASIWMALRTLKRREGNLAYSPAEITNAATQFLVRGRVLPNKDGLVVEQITEALRTAGYAPHMIPLKEIDQHPDEEVVEEAKSALYPYIESGIPILLILYPREKDGHAVLLIGHGWDQAPGKYIKNWEIKLSDGKK